MVNLSKIDGWTGAYCQCCRMRSCALVSKLKFCYSMSYILPLFYLWDRKVLSISHHLPVIQCRTSYSAFNSLVLLKCLDLTRICCNKICRY